MGRLREQHGGPIQNFEGLAGLRDRQTRRAGGATASARTISIS